MGYNKGMQYLLKVGILCVVYFFAARFGLGFEPVSGFATLVWPPSGIALAALLLFGTSLWPGIFFGAFLVNLVTGAPVFSAMGIGLGNMLEAVIGAYFLKQIPGFQLSLSRLKDALGLILLAAGISTTVAATVGASSLWAGGVISFAAWLETWEAWWLGDFLGILVVTPLLLSWRKITLPSFNLRRCMEGAAIAVLFVFAVMLVYGGWAPAYGFAFIPLKLLPILWAALRFGQRGSSLAVFAVVFAGIYATAQGVGPFAAATLFEGLFSLQMYLSAGAITGLLFAASITEIRRVGERFQHLIEKSTDAISLSDAHGTATYVSPSVKHILGYEPEELAAMSGWDIIHPDDFDSARRIQEKVYGKNGASERVELRVKRKDGKWIWVETVVTNLLADPAVGAVVSNFRDVTERKEIDLAKSDFVSLASHQLRTPLTVIQWHTDAILQRKPTTLGAKEKSYLKKIAEANKRMIDLVDALLNVSRIEMGTLGIEPEEVDLGTIADTELAAFSRRTKEKHLHVERTYDDTLPKIKTDPRLMKIIFQNLISNATRYTLPNGKVRIAIEKRGGDALITVEDTGIGIPEHEQKKIFTKMFRTQSARQMEPNGTGLGLYLVKAVVELCGGKIWFASTEGKGTEFYVLLPLKGVEKKEGKVHFTS